MPFPFTLPTTSAISFSHCFESSSHPSLSLTASTYRGVLRDALKKHKRLPPASKSVDLSSILQTLEAYIPYLLALDAGLSCKVITGEETDVILTSSPAFEWRPILSSAPVPGREPPRLKLKSLEYEIAFTLASLAYTHTLLSRAALHPLYSTATASPTQEARVAAIQNATKSLLLASSIHIYISSRLSLISTPSPPADLSTPAHSALASLAHAEATLLAVLKDDPYPASLAQALNRNDKEWMIRAAEIPKVRAHLFARLCLAASEHASKAVALLKSAGRVDEDLVAYVEDLRIVGRAKACRFFGVDSELGGETGIGIAWLHAAKSTLMIEIQNTSSSKSKFSLSRMRKDISEKREEKRIEKGGDWGADAGRAEEGRVVEFLESKWTKMNDTINTQIVPPEGPLLAGMPSGRDIHVVKPWHEPELDESVLFRLRAPPVGEEEGRDLGEDSSDDEWQPGKERTVAGAFPGSKTNYAGSGSYY